MSPSLFDEAAQTVLLPHRSTSAGREKSPPKPDPGLMVRVVIPLRREVDQMRARNRPGVVTTLLSQMSR